VLKNSSYVTICTPKKTRSTFIAYNRVDERREEGVKMDTILADMDFESIIYILREIVFWSGVISFIAGVLLIAYRKYDVLEAKLAKEIGGIRYKIFPKLEDNIYTYHEKIMKRRKLLGLICIVYSLIATVVLRQLSF